MTEHRPPGTIQVDIVSDVVCPWCIVGYKQLEQALAHTDLVANLRWHPFELNPDMPPQGQNLREHIIAKYGMSADQSTAARNRLTALGAELGFTFNYSDDTRMVNTFAAHQLLDWAEQQGRQHPLKLALLTAFFTDGKDVSNTDVLVSAAASVGLDEDAAGQALASGVHADTVRQKQSFWLQRGISGVPSMVFCGKYLMTGAQGVDAYVTALERCRADAVAQV